MRVSCSDLEDAFSSRTYEAEYWLDRQTGEVIFISEDTARWASGEDETANAPEWQLKDIEQARRVLRAVGELESDDESEHPDRYLSIPTIDSAEAFRTMEEFVQIVGNLRLRDSLIAALRGGKPFRRFRDVLAGYPPEREQWFAFERQRLRETIKNWAELEGLETDFTES